MGDRAGETQPSCSWTQFRATGDSKKFKYTVFGREESGLSKVDFRAACDN